jgi:hypothetical protein
MVCAEAGGIAAVATTAAVAAHRSACGNLIISLPNRSAALFAEVNPTVQWESNRDAFSDDG